ncbi:MAG: DNA polymerase III subunit gamma/tau [Acidimicrobiaceae bacterium]|nr:MAG: DNA polymerase III subunit gamma/tau [Acidimicrobiaceae bacterium]
MQYTSLYRRYRPRRFSEIRGQDHVVAALRNAVKEDRVHHAYLLSGPRGTGKTTAARILAKVLNCDEPLEGEPCCACDSCLAIDAGNSFDLHELDAASNNKVDDMRDLLGKVALGTPGRIKVYLLDEVHMLTSGAENALLKTLEEPPDHVIFILATTEPHKVVETIRSRSQHLELKLLSKEDLESLVEDVVNDAELDVDAGGKIHAVRSGRGSARDTLSALDRVVSGGIISDDETVHNLLAALAERNSSKALGAVSEGISRGREPRVIAEELLGALRTAFLLKMGVPSEQIGEEEINHSLSFSDQVTPGLITKALEVIGVALVDMRRAPDPRVDLEVALVRLTREESQQSNELIEALVARVDELERKLSSMSVVSSTPAKPSSKAKEILSKTPESPPPQKVEEENSSSSEESPLQEKQIEVPGPIELPELNSVAAAWKDVIQTMSKRARSRLAASQIIDIVGAEVVLGLPNEPHRQRCMDLMEEIQAALSNHFSTPLQLRLDVVSSSSDSLKPTPKPKKENLEVDTTGSISADTFEGSATDHVIKAFPGAEIVDN